MREIKIFIFEKNVSNRKNTKFVDRGGSVSVYNDAAHRFCHFSQKIANLTFSIENRRFCETGPFVGLYDIYARVPDYQIALV